MAGNLQGQESDIGTQPTTSRSIVQDNSVKHVTVYLQNHPAREQGDRENTQPRRFLRSSSLRSKPSALIRRLKNCARNYGTTGILPDSFKSSSSSGAIRVPVKQQRLGEAVDWPRCCGTSGPGAGGVVSFWGLLVVRATSLLFGTLDLLGFPRSFP